MSEQNEVAWLMSLLVFLAAFAGCYLALLFDRLMRRWFTSTEQSFREMHGLPVVDDSPAKREWDRLQDMLHKESEEEPFGVTEFTPVEQKVFDPDEYMEWPQCTSCSRKPARAEYVYEVPLGDGSANVKLLCFNCGRIPA